MKLMLEDQWLFLGFELKEMGSEASQKLFMVNMGKGWESGTGWAIVRSTRGHTSVTDLSLLQ